MVKITYYLIYPIHKNTNSYSDSILCKIEYIHLKVYCIRGIRFKQINGDITMNGVAVSLENVYSDHLLLHPTQIVIKTSLHSSINSEPIKSTTKLNIIINKILLDLSRSNCKILLLTWNVYKHLFKAKNNIIQNYSGNYNTR